MVTPDTPGPQAEDKAPTPGISHGGVQILLTPGILAGGDSDPHRQSRRD